MNILIDADALVALVKKDDSNHRKATDIIQKIKTASIFTSPFTIPEAATVLSHRVSQKAAVLFLTEMRKRYYTQISMNDEIEKRADEVFSREKKKRTSWVDCLNIALIELHGLDGVFSFDKMYGKHDIMYVQELLSK